MNRLRFPTKFAVIGLMFMLPLAVVMRYFLDEVNHTIAVATSERQGTELDFRVNRLSIALAGNAGAILAGPSDRASWQATQALIDRDINDAASYIGPSTRGPIASAVVRRDLAITQSDWSILRDTQTNGRAAQYSRLMSNVATTAYDVGLQSELVLDPQPATYSLMDTLVSRLPHLMMHYAWLRLLSAGHAHAHRWLLSDLLQINEQNTRTASAVESIRTDLGQVYIADSRLKLMLQPSSGDIERVQSQISDSVSLQLTEAMSASDGAPLKPPNGSLVVAAESYNQTASSVLDGLLRDRIASVSVKRFNVCVLALGSLLLSVYLFGGFYVGTLQGMRRLIETAQRISHGGDEDAANATPLHDFHDVANRGAADDIGQLAVDLEKLIKERTDALILARNAADAANLAKSQFLANMSHELRTPLNSVLGFSILLRSDPSIGTEHKATLNIINASGEHLLSLINDVLDVARIEAGRMTLDYSAFDLARLMREITDMMRHRASEAGLDLICDQSSQFPRFVRSDAPKIRQILINVIGNAVKYTGRGQVTVKLNAAAAQKQPSDQSTRECRLVFEVVDTGPGILAADQERIFEPFVQLSASASRKGAGLGLAIVKQFVDLLSGSLHVTSVVGEGSTFRIELPVDLADEAEVLALGEEHGRVLGLANRTIPIRILVVEDQMENSLLLDRLLSSAGFQVKVAENGVIGVAMFEQWHPHFIWMDRRMPVMDGIEAVKRIRSLPGGDDVKISGLSASALTDQRVESLHAGMDDFVGKPFRADEIFDCMARHLDIEYIYSEPEPTETVSVLNNRTLDDIPDRLKRELRVALVSLDTAAIVEVIRRIAAVDSNIGRLLHEHADKLAYTAILKALGPVGTTIGEGAS